MARARRLIPHAAPRARRARGLVKGPIHELRRRAQMDVVCKMAVEQNMGDTRTCDARNHRHDGQIDEVKIYSTAFSAKDRKHLKESFLIELSKIHALLGDLFIFCRHICPFAVEMRLAHSLGEVSND